ncbi:putative RNA methyltransferase [Actinocorallia populi]|uniref:putative RNA methyltransferase n=1 Tax=Actinocorallia populi TaxID=2079200 RepID=UPI000D092950|nr:methyltransferase domain-containing protein [Actinocorallia populi]
MLSDVEDLLACPLCRGDLTAGERALRCPAGHSFDVARQGYASLLAGGAATGTADTAAMVQARAGFLDAGHYTPLASALAELASGTVLDAGAGTGHYLAAALRSGAAERGLALDLSKHAMRRAARAHPGIGAVVADLWRDLPVRDAVVDTVYDVFAPRNAPEFRRVLRPGGRLLVATPTAAHLAELVGPLGLLSVDERKDERLAETFAGTFRLESADLVTIALRLTSEEAATLVGMTPSAHHVPEGELRKRLAGLGTEIDATAQVRVAVYLPER